MNPVELLADIFKSYSKVDNSPLHVGEVMNLWTMLAATENFVNSEQISLNYVQDNELAAKLKDLIENYHKPVIKEIKEILLREDAEVPREPVEKPKIKLDLPLGGRMTDEEVANFVVFNLVWAITFCARGLTESVRADIGTFFVKLIVQKSTFSVTLKQLMVDKGWLKKPPVYRIQGRMNSSL
jgi:hypothetical protein